MHVTQPLLPRAMQGVMGASMGMSRVLTNPVLEGCGRRWSGVHPGRLPGRSDSKWRPEGSIGISQ